MTQYGQRYFHLLHITVFLVAVLLSSFGILGYATYGDQTSDVITMNLPLNVVTSSVKIGLIFAIFCTYPLQLYPVSEIVEKNIFRNANLDRIPYWDWKRNCLRTLVVFTTGAIAYLVPQFGLISGFVGALGSSMLAFLLPVTFQLVLFKRELSWWVIAKDIAILLFGIATLCIGTATSLRSLIDSIS